MHEVAAATAASQPGVSSSSSSTDPTAAGCEPVVWNQRYTNIQPLGSAEGKFGVVQLARHNTTGELVAIKFVRPDGRNNKYIVSEILNHSKLHHPCVIQFKEVFAAGSHVGIVMEYATGGSLYGHVKGAPSGRLTEDCSRWFFQQLIIGLDYCHHKGVVNRDIKLSNSLVQVYTAQCKLPELKVADFGFSKEFNSSAPKTRLGTSHYMAPEVITTTSNRPYDGRASDVWSCGVMLFWMLTGGPPFDAPECRDRSSDQAKRLIMKRIVDGQWSVPADIPVSEGCLDLLRHILVSDPAQRYTIDAIFQHPWFRQDPCNLLPARAPWRFCPPQVAASYLASGGESTLQSEEEIQQLLDQVLSQQR